MMETTLLYQIVLLALAAATFLFWSCKGSDTRFMSRTSLVSIAGLMTLLCGNEWGFLGCLYPLGCLLGAVGILWITSDGWQWLQEMFGDRRGIEADFYAKKDGTNILVWPMNKEAKRLLKTTIASANKPKRRGGHIFLWSQYEKLVETTNGLGKVVAEHNNLQRASNPKEDGTITRKGFAKAYVKHLLDTAKDV